MNDVLIVRQSEALLDYQLVWQAMRQFTSDRQSNTQDELWLLEHPPVFTQGQAGKPEHILNAADIPVIQTDRGGQVTYHGPGQLIAYLLCDIQRLGMGVRALVSKMERVVIDCLAELSIAASAQRRAPGVYVGAAKIASIGLRIRRGGSYHGLAFNVDMDLTPFSYINPCGQRCLKMTQVTALLPQESLSSIRKKIIPYFLHHFGYKQLDSQDLVVKT